MAIPLLAGITKALVSQAPKIAAKQFSKKAVKNAAKNFVKGKVKDKLKGKKKKKGGALVKTEGGLTTYSVGEERTSRISPQKLLPQGVDVDANVQTVSPKGKISYDKIQQQLDNIEGITSALNKAFQGELTAKKEASAKAKKAAQNARKKEREEKREGKTTKSAGLGSILPKGDPLNIFNFLKNILLGGALLFLVKQAPKIAKVFGTLKDNLYAFFLGAKYGLKGMKGAFKALGAGVKALGKGTVKLALAPFKLAGRGIRTALGALGTGVKNFVGGVVNRILRLLGIKPPPGLDPNRKGGSGKTTLTGSGATTAAQMRGQRATAGYRSPGRYRSPGQALAGGTFQSQVTRAKLTGPQATVRPGSPVAKLRQFGASLQTGTAFGGKGASLQRGVSRTAVQAQKTVQTTNTFLKKIFGITDPAQVQSLKNASPALKKGTSVLKGARLPVVGPLIVFTMNALDPEISVGKAAFKAVGAGLGEFLGLLTPIPGIGQLIGPILGGLAGEVLGGAAYELIINRNPAAAGQEIIDAFMAALDVGKKVVEWLKGAAGRFYDALPKLKMPDWIPGIGGKEIINPEPIGLFSSFAPAMMSAVFGKKTEEGEKKELESDLDTSANKPYFEAAGGYYSKETRGYLGATEAEARQKLGLTLPSSPQTTPVTTAAVSGGGSDFWTLAAVAAMEDSDGQARADVAQSIYNRKASGAYGSGTIRELIIADKQFQPTWDYPRKNSGMKANPEWHNITDAATAAAATGKSVAFINQAAADIQNKQYQEEAKRFVGGRTDFTNYSKTNRKGQVVRSTNAPNNYFGWDWNYQGNTMGGVPNFNTTTTTTQPSQPATTPPGQPQNNEQQEAQQAQKQRIQELQKKIENTEKLLATGGLFAPGTSLGYITRENLKADKAELAKLTAQPLTPMMPPAPAQTTPVTTPMQTSGSAITRTGQTTGTQKGDMISGYEVTSAYGQRWDRLHGGIDIGTPVGTFVGLSVPVEIVYAGRHGSTGSGYGNVVDAWAPSLGLQFRLAHLNTILCQKGQKLPAGTALGKTGGAQNDPGRGSSTGPHLHFEVDNQKNGMRYGGLGDPSPYVQYLILSANGPAAGAVVTTPAAVAQQNATAVSQNPSYSASANNTAIIPAPQQQQPMMMGGGQGQGAIVMGGSTREVVNSYYKKQLLGFLYKQG